MTSTHKNKTLTTFLASTLGSIGIHRFYLHGSKDLYGWLHAASLPISVAAIVLLKDTQSLFASMLFVLSVLSSFIEALVIGLTPDDKWDVQYNPDSGKTSESHWILALILVVTLGVGATAVIALLARSFDLLFTGGAYG